MPLDGSLKSNVKWIGDVHERPPPPGAKVPLCAAGSDVEPVRSVTVAEPPSGVTLSVPESAVAVASAVNDPPGSTSNGAEASDKCSPVTSIVASGGRNGKGFGILPF